MNFTVRKQPFSLIKETVIFNDHKKNFLTATLKPYKLKEEITIYNGKQELILKVISKSTLNISQTFFVFDQKGNQLGTIKKDNINSLFLYDKWIILDKNKQEIIKILDSDKTSNILEKYVPLFEILRKKTFLIVNKKNLEIGTIKTNRAIFFKKLNCEIKNQQIKDQQEEIDSNLFYALTSLLILLEE
jgi:hypothetical protein